MKGLNDLLEYTCSETGLTGYDLSCYADIENAREEGSNSVEDFEQHLVEKVTEYHGDAFGTTFQRISQNILDHMAKHAECKGTYAMLKMMGSSEFDRIMEERGKIPKEDE